MRGDARRAGSTDALLDPGEVPVTLLVMDQHFDVIDCDEGKAWRLGDEGTAVRYAAGRHAATGHVIEVVRTGRDGSTQVALLPPGAPLARP
jgi:hypothetical protein